MAVLPDVLLGKRSFGIFVAKFWLKPFLVEWANKALSGRVSCNR